MMLRYAGACRSCGMQLTAGTMAVYERTTKTVRCLACSPRWAGDNGSEGAGLDAGTAGASARRELERRKARRKQRIRAAHPKVGGLILALSRDPQSTMAWAIGATGEERLGKRLDLLVSPTCQVLHDRRVPGGRANIDHIAVARSGIYVIDAKTYKGRPQLRVKGGFLRPRVEMLLVGGRDCTKLVDGVLRQTEAVRAMIGSDVPVHGVLCFVGADWPLVGGSFNVNGVEALWPRRLASKLDAKGRLDRQRIGTLHQRLAFALPPA
jgi:hypothetical protein